MWHIAVAQTAIDRWGTYPQWLGALSVPATVYVILRDRRKSQNEKGAALLAWHTNRKYDYGLERHLVLHNSTSRPFYDLYMWVKFNSREVYVEMIPEAIEPGQELRVVYEIPSIGIADPQMVRRSLSPTLYFTDDRGTRWRKSIENNRLIRINLWRRQLERAQHKRRTKMTSFDNLFGATFAVTLEHRERVRQAADIGKRAGQLHNQEMMRKLTRDLWQQDAPTTDV